MLSVAFLGNLLYLLAHFSVANKCNIHSNLNKIAVKVMILSLDKSGQVLKKVKRNLESIYRVRLT